MNNNGFNSLLSTKKYNKGDIIKKLEGPIINKPTRTSIEIDTNKHIEDEVGIFINHSFNPNTKIENGCIIAIKDICENDPITFNYNEN